MKMQRRLMWWCVAAWLAPFAAMRVFSAGIEGTVIEVNEANAGVLCFGDGLPEVGAPVEIFQLFPDGSVGSCLARGKVERVVGEGVAVRIESGAAAVRPGYRVRMGGTPQGPPPSVDGPIGPPGEMSGAGDPPRTPTPGQQGPGGSSFGIPGTGPAGNRRPPDSDVGPLGPIGPGTDAPGAAMPAKGPWLFPDSSRRPLTPEELSRLGPGDLWRARNEIFARRGYKFSTPQGMAYATSLGPHYRGTDDNQDRVYGTMDSIEKANIEFIKTFEERNR